MNAKTIAIALLIVAAALPSGIPRFGVPAALGGVILLAVSGFVLGYCRLRKRTHTRKVALELHTAEEHDDEIPKAA